MAVLETCLGQQIIWELIKFPADVSNFIIYLNSKVSVFEFSKDRTFFKVPNMHVCVKLSSFRAQNESVCKTFNVLNPQIWKFWKIGFLICEKFAFLNIKLVCEKFFKFKILFSNNLQNKFRKIKTIPLKWQCHEIFWIFFPWIEPT